jgi:hypothetical protein
MSHIDAQQIQVFRFNTFTESAMKIFEVAAVVAISVLGVGAGQNVAMNDASMTQSVRGMDVQRAYVVETLAPVQRKASGETLKEIPMLPPIDVAPVGAFSFSF